ncbi:MAG: YdbL family protein [Methylococcales bacterium]
MRAIPFFSALLLTACVTINIYFPAAAAEKVADEIIKGIQSEQSIGTDSKPVEPQSQVDPIQLFIYQVIDTTIEFVIPSAYAAPVDLSVNSAEIRQLRAKMKARFSVLKSFYARGVVGIQADGFITVRGSVSLKNRNKVNKLVAAENTDRQRLYQAIANANGHPEWFAQIKSTFAARWISNAQPGWWYQSSNGSWKQK